MSSIKAIPGWGQYLHSSIPDRFEEIVRRYPQRLAVKMGARSLTYDELNRYANRIARAIVAERGGRQEAVALCLNHGLDLVAAIFAVLKSGKFYVALDPESSDERLRSILDDSAAQLVLADDANSSRREWLGGDAGHTRLIVQPQLASGSDADPRLPIEPDSYASLTYTSGSTGVPKGVIETHRYRLHDTLIHTAAEDIGVNDTLSLVHRAAFASASIHLFRSLLNGASLVLWDAKDNGLAQLPGWLEAEKITVLHLTPAGFRNIRWPDWRAHPSLSLRLVHLSGAPITNRDFELYRKNFPAQVRLGFHLGSTESGGIASAVVDQTFSFPSSGTPAGYPMIDKRVTLVDENGHAVRLGEIGEIAVESKYLTAGYWKRPELTARKFVATQGCRSRYLTGDMASISTDGFIVHHGRKDLLVKVRGFRVELGDVERALLESPAVAQAAVSALEDDSRDKYLAAYVVLREGSFPTVSELKRFLRTKIPEYMTPASFVFLRALPLINGKVDRAALPQPDRGRPDLDEPYVPPQSGLERRLARIWAEVLRLDEVGINDNFFDLGGHSVAGAQVLARIKEQCDIELTVGDLLACPTVAELTERIGYRQRGDSRDEAAGCNAGLVEHRETQSGVDFEAPPARVELTDQGFEQRSIPELFEETPWRHADDAAIAQGSPSIHDPARLHPSAVPGIFKKSSIHGFSRQELEQSIPARFEKIASLYPDHVAIRARNQSITYAELNAMANRMAHAIVAQRGSNPEPIGILIDKGVEQIAAMLAVFKARKFAVFFDPAFPRERNLAIARDTRPALILTNARNEASAAEIGTESTSILQTERIGACGSAANLALEITPDSFAYIIYTSGSTGQPKGVIHDHRSRLHVAGVYADIVQMSENDRSILLTSGTANTIANSLYALLRGAALHLFNINELGLSELARYLISERISVCAISTPLFRKLCECLTGNERFEALRILRLSSEASYRSDFELYKRYFPRTCILANMLAPTETGILRYFLMNHDTRFDGDEIPLGYEVPDTSVFLVNDDGEKVGINEIGEIVVRSRYLSRGYWNRPELNEEKFTRDRSGEASYRTGDLGLMLSDGCLVHKGRKDFRIKVRGYGVDPAEIEKRLRSHPAISDAVVIGQNGRDGETRIVAYFTSDQELAPAPHELRAFMQAVLPEYMLPTLFVRVPKWPLTHNGKIDRKALPQPSDHRPRVSAQYARAKNQGERMLVRIWEETLSVHPIGIHDDFFELGGDSLKFASMIARVKAQSGIELAAAEVVTAPVISALARRLLEQSRSAYRLESAAKTSAYAVGLRVGAGGKNIFCFPYRGGFHDEYFNFCRISRHFPPEYSFYGLRARGVIDGNAPRGTIKQIAQDFVEAIRSVQSRGPYVLVGECGGGIPAFETARQLEALGEQVEILVLLDTQAWSFAEYIWRRLKEPFTYRKRLGLLPPGVEYLDKRLQYHFGRLKQLRGARRIHYILTKCIQIPKLVALPVERGIKKPRLGPGAGSTASNPPISRSRIAEKDYFVAAHRYRFRRYRGRIAFLVNEEWYRRNADLKWRRFAKGLFNVYPIPGDHDHCVPDNIPRVAGILKACLERCGVQRGHIRETDSFAGLGS